ncbi:NAD(+) diphosphatase [Micromonospora endophytica]|uniref:NAD(+) diphosphatase n=1 Tax=Micromonospora endophytica TaxID=515350 RepID=A0A2W2BSC1_9ACTN|nr:NAD(+) diphosphatase [Micromonospora endophytica]PZF90131.1 NAD(+) diphosphatase [Micromonospora endophytica]RIW44655.1 NAD(+) diphosphatase [Micromonospora endophytica]BCJ60399.1 putative NADH pyrophosphatase/NUDIX hydrolase [Micromonospora endophytica]
MTSYAGAGQPVAAGGEAAPPLARSTLDRAAHRRTDPAWLAQAWAGARVLVLDVEGGGQTLVRTDTPVPTLVLTAAEDLPPALATGAMFLGVEPDGVPVFCVHAPLAAAPDTRAVNLRQIGHLLGDRDAGLFTTALALTNWHLRHLYHPVTGAPTRADEAGWSRVDAQGERVWPRTDPAMIVLVHDGVDGQDGRCLLGNNAAWPNAPGQRRFSCLAGYVEPGESAEATVLREVREEVGVPVGDITYAGSQAWPFPGSLMLGFLATADPAHPLRVDPTEIAEARWFSRQEIGATLAGRAVDVGGASLRLPPASSIALFLIHRWLDGHC